MLHLSHTVPPSFCLSSFSKLDLSSSPPGPYHQDAYIPKQEEKFKSPPILPPHLLQVILNKDTGISVSSSQFISIVDLLKNKLLVLCFVLYEL